MSTAICPGSFDPITLGHLNIIRRASRIFDEVVVCILFNAKKTSPMFSIDERVEMAERACKKYGNVKVVSYSGLLADFVAQFPNGVVVKGLRANSDFEYEFQMNQINKHINPEMETLFLTSDVKYTFLSSSVVRELAQYNADLHGFVPDEIIDDINKKAESWRK